MAEDQRAGLEEELMKLCIYDENGKRMQGFLILGQKSARNYL